MRRALMFANGEWREGVAVDRALAEFADADVIAADGGVRYALSLDLPVRALIGDLDSTPEGIVRRLTAAGTTVVRYGVEKNETDLELCLAWATQQGYRHIQVLAAFGGRFDQEFSNVMILAAPELKGRKIQMISGNEVLQVHHPGVILFTGKQHDRLSLIPLTPEVNGIHTRGLKYPLVDETLFMVRGRGISNEFTGPEAEVHFSSGILCSVQEVRPI
ncbi:MAG: thiamine diphosphokinase [Chloroflexi bacterium]|nr:thiamine diphosphokinase [Chloroflexota bacterium]